VSPPKATLATKAVLREEDRINPVKSC
jgi:hypothetical protein